jgi:hypothetical protein
MKKIIRLTEKDLTRIVKRVIKEQDEEWKSAPAKGNDHLNDIFDEIQSIADYVRDTFEFSNRMRDFYNDYKEELDELTDEEYTKLEYFVDKMYREVKMDKDNMNGSMYDDDELIDADDY